MALETMISKIITSKWASKIDHLDNDLLETDYLENDYLGNKYLGNKCLTLLGYAQLRGDDTFFR